jgi:HAD superfamily hydrolase (TIGR01549 family)
MPLEQIEFIFFDVGNIFVSDDPSSAFLYRKLYDYLGGERRWSPEEFFAARLAHVESGGHLWSFIAGYVGEHDLPEWRRQARAELYAQWDRYSPPIPGMAEAAQELARHYRLGLIANQPRQIRDVLARRGFWELFEVRAISEELGLEKPDPAIFQWALDRSGVEPARALMVGDRVDNDIAPARRLGMRTLWLSMDFDIRGWQPTDRFERAYAASVRRNCVTTRPPAEPDEQPDWVAHSPQELLALLLPGREVETVHSDE